MARPDAAAEKAHREADLEDQERLAEALSNGLLEMTPGTFLGLVAFCAVVSVLFFGGMHIANPL